MGVDMTWQLYINPDKLTEWTNKEVAGVIIHEVWHLLMLHGQRCIAHKADHELWNVAADCEINDDIIRCGISLPTGALTPQTYNLPTGHTTEHYYEKLKKSATKKKKKISNEGSGVTGKKASWESGKGSNPSPVTKKMIQRQVAEGVNRAAGKTPSFAKRWADDICSSKIAWQQRLGSCIRNALSWTRGMIDYTYSRPNRRQSAFGRVIQPSLRAPQPRIAILIDTSGSIRREELAQALAETKTILETVRAAITVYSADTRVHTRQKVYSASEITPIGGGGTDMGNALQEIAKDGRSDICIVFTDGYTPWCEIKPPQIGKVIVCLIAGGYGSSSHKPPSWSDVIEIKNEKSE
jgi:predicted metal-dependent peptidase